MPKTLLAVLGAVLLSAQMANAQKVPELFVGYSNLQAEGLSIGNSPNGIFDTDFFRDRGTLHGANVSFSGFDISGLGLTGDVSWNTQRKNSPTDSSHTDIWYFLAGPSMKWNRTPGGANVEPFVRVMAGAAHTRYRASAATPTTFDSFRANTTDFAIALGGGIDIRAAAVKVRVLQVDYVPIFLGSNSISVLSSSGAINAAEINNQRQDNIRFSFGLVF